MSPSQIVVHTVPKIEVDYEHEDGGDEIRGVAPCTPLSFLY